MNVIFGKNLKPCPITKIGIIAHVLLLTVHVLPLNAHRSLLMCELLSNSHNFLSAQVLKF